MKKFLFVLSTVILCSSVSFAGGLIGFGVQATGAALNVAEPLKAVYGAGYGGGAHVDINLPILLSIRVAGDYTTYSPDLDQFKGLYAAANPTTVASGFEIDGGRINIFSLSANGKLGFPMPVLSPYLTAGAGIASINISDVTAKYQGQPLAALPGGKTGTNASVNFGAGVDLSLVVTLYLEAKYTIIFTEGSSSSFVPVSLGITF